MIRSGFGFSDIDGMFTTLDFLVFRISPMLFIHRLDFSGFSDIANALHRFGLSGFLDISGACTVWIFLVFRILPVVCTVWIFESYQ